MNDLKIAIVQTSLFWEDIAANLAMLEEKIWKITEKVDLIILPEMFNSGFSMNPQKIAEPINGHTTKWMKQLALQTKATICGSFAVKENGLFYNRFHFVQPNGLVSTYDKINLFSYSGESEKYVKGKDKLTIQINGWKIFPQICFDLRFPETSRNQVVNSSYNYDVLVYVANWPQSRIASWTHLLEARAIENSCYSVGVNRVGQDGNNLIYNGQSAVCFAKPENNFYLSSIDEIKIFTLSASKLLEYRKEFPFFDFNMD